VRSGGGRGRGRGGRGASCGALLSATRLRARACSDDGPAAVVRGFGGPLAVAAAALSGPRIRELDRGGESRRGESRGAPKGTAEAATAAGADAALDVEEAAPKPRGSDVDRWPLPGLARGPPLLSAALRSKAAAGDAKGLRATAPLLPPNPPPLLAARVGSAGRADGPPLLRKGDGARKCGRAGEDVVRRASGDAGRGSAGRGSSGRGSTGRGSTGRGSTGRGSSGRVARGRRGECSSANVEVAEAPPGVKGGAKMGRLKELIVD
jgi:hypothetical protein